MEQTFFIIKPDAIKRGLIGQILSRVERRGFVIRDLNMMTATEDLVGSGKDIHDGSALTHRIMKTDIKPSLGV